MPPSYYKHVNIASLNITKEMETTFHMLRKYIYEIERIWHREVRWVSKLATLYVGVLGASLGSFSQSVLGEFTWEE